MLHINNKYTQSFTIITTGGMNMDIKIHRHIPPPSPNQNKYASKDVLTSHIMTQNEQ